MITEFEKLVFKEPKKLEDGYLVKIEDSVVGKICFKGLNGRVLKKNALSDNTSVLYIKVSKGDALSMSSSEDKIIEQFRPNMSHLCSDVKIKSAAIDVGYSQVAAFCTKSAGWVLKLRTYGKAAMEISDGDTIMLNIRLIGIKLLKSHSVLCWEIKHTESITTSIPFADEDVSEDEADILPDAEDIKDIAKDIVIKIQSARLPFEERVKELENMEREIMMSLSRPFTQSTLQLLESIAEKLEDV